MTKRFTIYIVVVFAILLLPSAGLLFAGPSDSTGSEKRELAELPATVDEDGNLNLAYLSGLGDWFEDHFAGRTAWVTVNALLRQATVGSTYGDEVIVGKDGYLFYRGTLDDYFRRDTMTDRELFITAHNLKMMEDYSRARGAEFAFVIAANKNSLYPEYMPDNYIQGEGETNAEALISYLRDAGVTYVDMHEKLRGLGEIYYKRDSHWTQEGALHGYDAIMEAVGMPVFIDYEAVWNTEQHSGDLDQMMLPEAYEAETAPRRMVHWSYTADGTPEDQTLVTNNPDGSGTLMMYRDSFGIGLIPYLSETFQTCTYTQIWPCIMNDVDQTGANVVILEKVERNLIDLAIRPAIMRPPETETLPAPFRRTDSELELRPEGSLVQIHGSVQPDLVREDTLMYITLGEGEDAVTYEAFLSTNSDRSGNDCYIYVGRSQLEQKPVLVQLTISGPNGLTTVCEATLQLEEEDASGTAQE